MHDREVVTEAIRQKAGALWCASVELKHDRDVVFVAITIPSGRMVMCFGLLRRS